MTLIELMITVAIVALLASVALPAYQGSVRKARRADAKTALAVAAQQMERYYTEKGTFVGATIGAVPPDTIARNSDNKHYVLSFSTSRPVTANTYTVVATPQGAQVQDGCGQFTIDQKNTHDVINTNGLVAGDCW